MMPISQTHASLGMIIALWLIVALGMQLGTTIGYEASTACAIQEEFPEPSNDSLRRFI